MIDKTKKKSIICSVLAATFYNSWILGFWINPKIVGGTVLSELSNSDQPFFQIFILADIISGMFCILLFYNLFHLHNNKKKSYRYILFGIFLFGFTTALAPLFPYEDNIEISTKGITSYFVLPFIHNTLSSISLISIICCVIFSLIVSRNLSSWLLSCTIIMSALLSFSLIINLDFLASISQKINSILIAVWLIFFTVGYFGENEPEHMDKKQV